MTEHFIPDLSHVRVILSSSYQIYMKQFLIKLQKQWPDYKQGDELNQVEYGSIDIQYFHEKI